MRFLPLIMLAESVGGIAQECLMDGMKPAQKNQDPTRQQFELPVGGPLTGDLYDQLRKQAERHLRQRFGRATAGLTWQPTVLVNETLLRMMRQRRDSDSDGHFYALANTVMKRVLVDYIRSRLAQKRAGHRVRIPIDTEFPEPLALREDSGLDIEELLNSIDRLALLHPRKGDVARMRVLWGLTVQETAASLEVSRASVERDWRFAKAWLKREMSIHRPE